MSTIVDSLMANIGNSGYQQEFAKALGNALWQYIDGRMGQARAAEILGVRRNRLNYYLHDLPNGKRKEPASSVLYLACTKFPGFAFEHGGYRLKAVKLGEKRREKPSEQLAFSFYRQIKTGKVNVKMKRPPGRIELSLSLGAVTRRRVAGPSSPKGSRFSSDLNG